MAGVWTGVFNTVGWDQMSSQPNHKQFSSDISYPPLTLLFSSSPTLTRLAMMVMPVLVLLVLLVLLVDWPGTRDQLLSPGRERVRTSGLSSLRPTIPSWWRLKGAQYSSVQVTRHQPVCLAQYWENNNSRSRRNIVPGREGGREVGRPLRSSLPAECHCSSLSLSARLQLDLSSQLAVLCNHRTSSPSSSLPPPPTTK